MNPQLPTINIRFVFNNTNWATRQQKINNVIAFFSTDFIVGIHITNTNFTNIPYITVGEIGGINNTLGTTQTVDRTWYDKNITSLYPDADQIVFHVDAENIPANHTCIGIMQGVINSVVQICIFGINENDDAYVAGVNQGNSWELFVEHEIAHGLCLLQNVPDNVHTYFYSGQPKLELADLSKGTLTTMQHIVMVLKQIMLELTTEINQTKIMQSTTSNSGQVSPMTVQFKPKVVTWAQGIQKWEGAKASLNNPGNLKYSTLTASWGGKPGDTALDGGSICQFATFDVGFIALCNFLTLGAEDELKAFHQSRTLELFSKVYAGNPPQTYIDGVAAALEVSIDTDVATFLA